MTLRSNSGRVAQHEREKSYREFSGAVQERYGEAIKGYAQAPVSATLLLDKRDREYLQELFARGIPLKFVLAGITEGVVSHKKANANCPVPPRLRYCRAVIDRKIRQAKSDPGLRRASQRGQKRATESAAKKLRWIAGKLEQAKAHPDVTERLRADFEEFRDALIEVAGQLERDEISAEAAGESVESIPTRLAKRIEQECPVTAAIALILGNEIKKKAPQMTDEKVIETTEANLPDRLLAHFGLPEEWTI